MYTLSAPTVLVPNAFEIGVFSFGKFFFDEMSNSILTLNPICKINQPFI